MNVLNKFEIKLKENIETFKSLKKQTNESEVRFKREVGERQRVHQLYEIQVQNCRQLTDSLSKLETDSKITFEKQSIEFKEQKNLNLSQIQRMSEQISQLKQELNGIQNKCWLLEQSLLQKEIEAQKQNNEKSIASEMAQIQKKSQSLSEELNCLSQNQMQLKDIVESSDRFNAELKKQLNERNQQLSAANKDNSVLKSLVSEFREKSGTAEEALNHNELKSLRLTQQNDLQKQEINELRVLLEESIREKEFLTKQLKKTDIHCSQLTECGQNFDESTLTTLLERNQLPE